MSDEISHYVLSRKINEAILLPEINVKIVVKRTTLNRAILYISAPKSVRIERSKDIVIEAKPVREIKDDLPPK